LNDLNQWSRRSLVLKWIRKCCVADGDAPPERFDHVDTLTGQSLQIDSSPGFLRNKWIRPLPKQESNTKASDIALSGFQARLATWRCHYEPNRPHFWKGCAGDFWTSTNCAQDSIWFLPRRPRSNSWR